MTPFRIRLDARTLFLVAASAVVLASSCSSASTSTPAPTAAETPVSPTPQATVSAAASKSTDPDASPAASIAGGAFDTCVVTIGGGVKCWGYNKSGRLGNGTTRTRRLTPINVLGLTSGVSAIAAGETHTCALMVPRGCSAGGRTLMAYLATGRRPPA